MTDLPELVDRATLMREMRLSKATADAIIREVGVVTIPGLRKTLVNRDAVAAKLEEWSFVDDGTRVR